MFTSEAISSTSILSVRVSSDEKAILQAAADETRSTISEFTRRKALEGAEETLTNRTISTISAQQWEAFEAFLDAPPQSNPALEQLLNRRPAWQE
ncbi:MAG: DUF1778 domain-containing protein [Gammaproteobacteria bacterium]|nr:DUF1778 domain-containing protein [Gammaproteobacteria bacterium]